MTVTSDEIYDAVIAVLRAKFAAVEISQAPGESGEPNPPKLDPKRIYLASEPYFDESMQVHIQVTLGTLAVIQADPAAAGGLVTEDFNVFGWTRVAKDPGHQRATQLISSASRSVLKIQTIVRSALIMSRLNGKASNHVVLMTGSPPLPLGAPPGWMCKGETYRVKYEIGWTIPS